MKVESLSFLLHIGMAGFLGQTGKREESVLRIVAVLQITFLVTRP
jgi:hypothetical protein